MSNEYGWVKILERHGRLPLSEVLRPAIEHAERGLLASEIIARRWAEEAWHGIGEIMIDAKKVATQLAASLQAMGHEIS